MGFVGLLQGGGSFWRCQSCSSDSFQNLNCFCLGHTKQTVKQWHQICKTEFAAIPQVQSSKVVPGPALMQSQALIAAETPHAAVVQPFVLRVQQLPGGLGPATFWALTRNQRSQDHWAPLPCKFFWNRKRLRHITDVHYPTRHEMWNMHNCTSWHVNCSLCTSGNALQYQLNYLGGDFPAKKFWGWCFLNFARFFPNGFCVLFLILRAW